MNREGGCLCGAVDYSFNSNAVISASHCHCTDCRKSTGSGKATIIMIQDSSLVVNGEIKYFSVSSIEKYVSLIIFSIFYWIGGFMPKLKNTRYRVAIPAIIIGIIIHLLIILDN